MTGFEPGSPGIRSNRAVNCSATTIAQNYKNDFGLRSILFLRFCFVISFVLPVEFSF